MKRAVFGMIKPVPWYPARHFQRIHNPTPPRNTAYPC